MVFEADEFLKKLDRGDFDGHLHEVLAKLPHEQLEQVARLMAERCTPSMRPSAHDFKPKIDCKRLDPRGACR